MHVIKLENINLDEISVALHAGQTFIYPTETCYGLGCDATNTEAVKKIFGIKGREAGKSVLMLAPSVAMVKEYAEWNEMAEQLAQQYWPGALTMILPVLPMTALAPGVIRQDGTVAFRVSADPFCQTLTQSFDRPIVSTSANMAGEQNLYAADAVVSVFAERTLQPDVFIDGGDLPVRPPSTIVQVLGNDVTIVRQGDMILKE